MVRRMTSMKIRGEAVGDLRWNLMKEGLLVRGRGIRSLSDRRLDVVDRNRLLGTGLVHGNRIWLVFLESRPLGKRMRLWLGQIVDRRLCNRNCPFNTVWLDRLGHLNSGLHDWSRRLSKWRQTNNRLVGINRKRRP
jgi:hypothetical protein